MLREYQLTNFKAFSNPQTIPIRPITLIYGANSSGKSSIIQSLLMLKQTLEQAEDTATVLLPQGSLVDLGNYLEFIHRHESERLFSFQTAFDIDSKQVSESLTNLLNLDLEDNLLIKLKIEFQIDSQSEQILLKSINYYLGNFEKFCVSYKAIEDSILLIVDKLNSNHPLWQNWFLKILPTIQPIFRKIERKTFDSFGITWNSSQEQRINALQKFKQQLEDDLKEHDINEEQEKNLSQVEALIKISTKLLDYKLEDALQHFTEVMQYSQLNGYNFLPQDLEIYFPETLESYLNILAEMYQKTEYFNVLSKLSQDTYNIFHDFISNLFYLGPFRDYPERFYIFGNHSNRQVGKSGKMMADILFKDRNLLEKVNQKFNQFNINYKLKCVSFHPSDESLKSDVYTIRLVDENNIHISLLDVGFGISQLLPVITQSMLSEKSTILIEQPELHLHPKLQTELGDLFIESALGERKNTFIIETHSEHLMLRIMRRMRETFQNKLPSNIPKIKPEDISVLFVETHGKSSIVQEMEINSRGEFIKSWPGGFFEEELRELFGGLF